MMRHLRRISLVPLLAVACALTPCGAQAAPAAHHDNVATAVTETDGSHVADFAWGISRQRGGDVDQLNSAHATARCSDCGARAIAFQIVLASGAGTVMPRNEAVALNVECTRCEVAAEARQFVRVYPQPMRLTGAGLTELAGVRQELRALTESNLPLADLHAAVEQQEARVTAILDTELVPASDDDSGTRPLRERVLQSSELN
jgi:putative peptide zinc metalloprotease protein